MTYTVIKTPEFLEWFGDQNVVVKVYVEARIDRIAQDGHYGDHRRFEGLIELRWKNGLRVYATQRGPRVWMLLGGTKHGQDRDIEKAKRIR